MIKIVGISGSLRSNSYNTMALKYIKEKFNNIDFEILDISNIPFFSEDLEDNVPESVLYIKEQIKNSDAVVIATPEYNASVSGVLKNALDWISRGDLKPLDGKKVAIMSASIGIFGGVKAQIHLRQILHTLNANVLNRPEVFIMKCNEKFDENGKLTDSHAEKSISEIMKRLSE